MSGLDNNSETITVVNTDYTFGQGDYDIMVLAAVSGAIVELPDGTLVPRGRVFRIYKDAATGIVDISSGGSSTIDGEVATTLAAGALHAKEFVSDGINWFTLKAY